MPTEIWCAIISSVTTLIVSIGTFQMSIRKDREKAKDELKQELIKYHEKNREEIKNIRENDLKEIRDDISTLVASFQQRLAVIEQKIAIIENNLDMYSKKVDKHNNVIERTFVLEEKISVANHRIDDLEHKVG